MLNKLKIFLGFWKRGVLGFLQAHLERVPGLPPEVLKFEIGKSFVGLPIECFQINNGPKAVLFVSAIHGNEVGTVSLARQLIEFLNSRKGEFSEFSFYVIPCLNPDGFALAQKQPGYFSGGRVGRFNSNKVDLNRNFPVSSFQSESVWSTGKAYAEKIPVYCGTAGGSEPEVRALINLIQQKNVKCYSAFHSVAGAVLGSNSSLGQKLASAFAQASKYRLESQEEWRVLGQTGTAKEWCEEQGIAYLEVEGKFRWSSDWQAHRLGIETVLKTLRNFAE